MGTRPLSDEVLKKTVEAHAKHGHNQVQTAAALKLSRQALQGRLAQAEARGFFAAPKVEPVSTFDRRFTSLRDENTRLRAALKSAHREANSEDILRDVIGAVAAAPSTPPAWTTEEPRRERGKPTPEVPIFCLADWHLGEVVEPAEVFGWNSYNMEIAQERAHRAVDGALNLCFGHHTGNYPGIVLPLLGDFVSGGLHPELKATDEEEVIPAAIAGIDWLEEVVKRLAGRFARVYVPCVAGNHGRGTAKPEFKRYYKKNFDWLIYQMLARRFAGDKRVHFDVRPANEVHFRVFNERYNLQHGDMLGVRGGDGIIGAIGPIMRGEVKKSGQSSAVGLGFDKLIIGHWHQRLWLPRAIVCNTLKGFDEYAKNQLGAKPDRPSQNLWFVHPSQGQTSHWDVYVDEKPAPAREWVSVMGAA